MITICEIHSLIVKIKKYIHPVFSIAFRILKVLFWVFFSCIFILQAIILLNIYNDLSKEMADAIKYVWAYAFMSLVLFLSIYKKNKKLLYVSAIGIILLFLYLSSIPELSRYFDYFEGLDWQSLFNNSYTNRQNELQNQADSSGVGYLHNLANTVIDTDAEIAKYYYAAKLGNKL